MCPLFPELDSGDHMSYPNGMLTRTYCPHSLQIWASHKNPPFFVCFFTLTTHIHPQSCTEYSRYKNVRICEDCVCSLRNRRAFILVTVRKYHNLGLYTEAKKMHYFVSNQFNLLLFVSSVQISIERIIATLDEFELLEF